MRYLKSSCGISIAQVHLLRSAAKVQVSYVCRKMAICRQSIDMILEETLMLLSLQTGFRLDNAVLCPAQRDTIFLALNLYKWRWRPGLRSYKLLHFTITITNQPFAPLTVMFKGLGCGMALSCPLSNVVRPFLSLSASSSSTLYRTLEDGLR